MIRKRPAAERGHVNHGWLDARHSFSFATYHDPAHMGFRTLRVLNDDRVAPGTGFGTHGHRDMEIITWVLDGELSHRDSMGNGSTLRPGDAQRMSAGSGIRHSEFNGSDTEGLRLLQIWILPGENGIEPGWEEIHFPVEERQGRLRLIASPGAEDGSLKIHQDARVWAGLLDGDDRITLPLDAGRGAWIQIARGSVDLNGTRLEEGDGAAVEDEDELTFENGDGAEVLILDLA
jgi:redox-sensitive bicupin YhaK (pirin superfamily)